MTKKANILKRIRNNTKDAKFGDVQRLLKDTGFKERQPKGGSSHYIFYHESLDRIVTLTKAPKALPEYQVKDALRALHILEVKNEKR